jgi:hypothetical protein
MAEPTRAHIEFRFEIGFEDAAGYTQVSRQHDRMQWVRGAVAEGHIDDDIATATRHYQALLAIGRNGRLNDALILTLQGCFQTRWQAALMLFVAAAEALLTSSKRPGLTKRLALAYACLLHTDKVDRDAAYDEFSECYAGRSDVVHGRGSNIAQTDRLKLVARWSTLLRDLWSHVLVTPRLVAILEGTDAQRAAFFQTVTKGYTR